MEKETALNIIKSLTSETQNMSQSEFDKIDRRRFDMTESEIQREIVAYLKVRDYMVFRMNSGYIKSNVKLSPKGTPDLLVIAPSGRVLWLEIKTATGKLNVSQTMMHSKLRIHKQVVFVVRCVDDVQGLLTK